MYKAVAITQMLRYLLCISRLLHDGIFAIRQEVDDLYIKATIRRPR